MFEITTVRGKGKGWKALRDIQPGTPLLGEQVLFWVLDDTDVDDSHERDHNEFRALSCPRPVTPQRRFDANSFAMGIDENETNKYGIFPQASRINHSCIPNAYFTWNPELGQSGLLTVYAIVHIPKDAEIVVDYCSVDSLKNARDRHQDRLHYGFKCTCPACRTNTAFARKSDERRERMKVLEGLITPVENQEPADQTTESLFNHMEISNLLQEEGLIYPDLADAYHGQALWWWRESERVDGQKGADEYQKECRRQQLQNARKKLDLDVICNGHDSSEVKKTLEFMCESEEE